MTDTSRSAAVQAGRQTQHVGRRRNRCDEDQGDSRAGQQIDEHVVEQRVRALRERGEALDRDALQRQQHGRGHDNERDRKQPELDGISQPPIREQLVEAHVVQNVQEIGENHRRTLGIQTHETPLHTVRTQCTLRRTPVR